MTNERIIDYIAAWLEHFIGERAGEMSVPEMEEFLYQHGYELVPPDEETRFTAIQYWQSVRWVARQRLTEPDRIVRTGWKA
ncbi:MAG: hypothetical protein QOG89_1745 [Thermomicrobiales bacterium]|nr:hypothetical protein [Thermomicrobiales bacterium]